MKIKKSVGGKVGYGRRDDIEIVQKLLNKPGAVETAPPSSASLLHGISQVIIHNEP